MKNLTNCIFPWDYYVSDVPFHKAQDSLIDMQNEIYTDVMFCAIRYHLHNFKNVKNTRGGVLLLVKLQALSLELYEM